MNSRRTLLMNIINEAAFRDTMQTLHNGGLDQTNRTINVMILNSRDQDFFALFQKVLLNCSDVCNVTDVLVESWVNSHVLGSHGEPLSMLVLVFDVENKWNASWIFTHHLFEEAHCQMNTLNDQRFVPLIE